MSNRPNGWVRLWVVLCVVWMSAVLLMNRAEIVNIHSRSTYEIKHDTFGTFKVVFSKAQSREDVQKAIDERIGPMIEKEPARYRDTPYDQPYHTYVEKHLYEKIWDTVRMALIPPVALLFLGWSVAWVRRGFRG